MRTSWYRPMLYVPIVGGLVVFYAALLAAWRTDWSETWLYVALGGLVIALVRIFIFTYEMWSSIRDGYERMTPAQAVGYNFIPVFNFLWLYQCIWGFARDLNAYIDRHHVTTKHVSTRVPLLYVTFWILSLIPYVSIVTIPVSIILVSVMLRQYCRALSALK